MTEESSAEQTPTETPVDGTTARLESSMSGLSQELFSLERATRNIELSAQLLAEQQESVSRELARTAEELRS